MSVSLSVDWWRVSMIVAALVAIIYSAWRFWPARLPRLSDLPDLIPDSPIQTRDKELAPDGTANYLKMIESDTPLATDSQRMAWAVAELDRFAVVKVYAAELERQLGKSADEKA